MIRKVTDAARWFAARPLAVYATIFAIYLIARVITVAGGEVFQSWDSAVYAYRDDPTRNRGPLVSFIGHAPRPWGLPLFFAMFPTDEWRAIGQSVLGAFAWTVLAWELTRHLKTRPAKYAAFASVLLLSALTNVTAWDFTILTESTTVSVGVLVRRPAHAVGADRVVDPAGARDGPDRVVDVHPARHPACSPSW